MAAKLESEWKAGKGIERLSNSLAALGDAFSATE